MDKLVFSGRQIELDLIKQKAESLFSNQQNQLLFISGLQGMGKTRLLHEANARFDIDQRFVNAYIDLRELKNTQVEETLEKMCLKLKKQNDIPFILFSFAYYVYFRKMHPSYDPPTFENSIKEKNETFRNIVSLCSKIPVFGEVFKLGDFVLNIVDLIGTSYKTYSIELAKSIESDLRNLDKLEALDVAELLPKFFASDLIKFTEENGVRTVFFLDVYDSILEKEITREAISNQEKWLFDSKKGLFHHLHNTLFVLTGRDEILWMKNSSNLKDVYSSKKLDKLEPEEIKALLESISEVEIRERFESITKGHPYTIDRAIDVYNQNENLSSVEKVSYFSKIDSPEILEDYFFKNMLDRDKTLLTLLSLCNFWDEEIFLFLNDTFKLGYSTLDFPKIINHSYVETSDNENFTLHSLMTKSLQDKCDQEIADKLHDVMFKFYQNKLKVIENHVVEFENKSNLNEAVFHGFLNTEDYQKLDLFFIWFFEVFKIFDEIREWVFLNKIFDYFLNIKFLKKCRDINIAFLMEKKAILLQNLYQWKDSLCFFKSAVDILRSLFMKDRQKYAKDLASTLNNYGNMLKSSYLINEALIVYKEALGIYKKYLIINIDNNQSVAILLTNLGTIVFDQYQWNVALEYYSEAEKIYDSMKEDKAKIFLFEISILQCNIGYLHHQMKHWDIARKYYEKCLTILKGLVNEETHLYEPNLANILTKFGDLYRDLDDWKLALSFYEEALRILRNLPDKNSLFIINGLAVVLNSLGVVYWRNKKEVEARSCYDESLTLFEELEKVNPKIHQKEISMVHNNFGILLLSLKKWNEAQTHLELALEIRKTLASKYPEIFNYDVAQTHNNLGNLFRDMYLTKEATKNYIEALKIRRILADKNLEAFGSELAQTLYDFSKLQKNNKQPEESLKLLEEALSILIRLSESDLRKFGLSLLTTFLDIGIINLNLRRSNKAKMYFDEALSTLKTLEINIVPFPNEIKKALVEYNELLNRIDND